VRTGQLVVFGPGDVITVSGAAQQESRHPALDVIVLGGAPIREPIAWGGPFVMNTRAEVMAAFADYQAGRLGTIPAQHLPPAAVEEAHQDS
jgi:redox-sensitive bicupin YhaK (pirin superfamily)